jgi:hypothetical protein
MTESQRTRFYFPKWAEVAQHMGWRMQQGRLAEDLAAQWECAATFSPLARDLVRAIIDGAIRLTRPEQRAVTVDDLRHALNLVASNGRTASSAKLTNPELNEFARICALLRSPFEDLNTTLPYLNPAEDDRQRSIAYLRRLSYDGQLRAISENMFKTREWETLNNSLLGRLILVVKKSGRTKKG